MRPPTFADVKAAYFFLWGAGPGFMLAAGLLVLAPSNLSRVREMLRDRQVKWAAVATCIGWIAPIVVSFWQPVFLPARTPVMLLPLTVVFIAFVLSQVVSRLAVLTLFVLFLIAAATQVAEATRGGDPMPSRASIQ